jgi:hypothetical protein
LGYPKKEKELQDFCGATICKLHILETNLGEKILSNPILNNSCDSGDFSHSYIIVYE